MATTRSLRPVARGAAVLAVALGIVGFLSLMGAFGPVACVTESTSVSGSASANGTEVVETPVVIETPHDCVSGIDYLLGNERGNAAALFAWPMVLLALVALGGGAAWTGRHHLTWTLAGAGAVISVLGAMSIGLYFAAPTLCLAVAAMALTADRRGTDGG